MVTRLRNDVDLVEAANQALVLNTDDLGALVASVHGDAAGQQFKALWVRHTDLLFDYTRAVAEDDAAARDQARTALDQYRSEYGAFVESATGGQIPAADAAENLRHHLDQLMGFADAYHAGDYDRAFSLEREAFAHMFPTGRALAGGLVNHPGELPVAVDDPAQQLRSSLGLLLGEHFELAVDAMRSAVVGSPDFGGAAAALDANKTDLTGAIDSLVGAAGAQQFNQAWATHIDLLVSYSLAVADQDQAAQDRARQQLAVATSFSALTGGALTVEAATEALGPHDQHLVDQLDAYARHDYQRSHEVAFEGYQHMMQTASAVAPAVEAFLAGGAPVGGAQTGGGGLARERPEGP
jgi:hypothetical protein